MIPVKRVAVEESADKTVGVRLNFETPVDTDGDSLINQYRKITGWLASFVPNAFKLVEYSRVCDCCNEQVNMLDNSVAFQCAKCKTRYDLCHTCQGVGKPKDSCPTDYGCNSELTSSKSPVI